MGLANITAPILNQVELWETVTCWIKLGVVMTPSTVMLGPRDLQDRIERGQATWVLAGAEDIPKLKMCLISTPHPDAGLLDGITVIGVESTGVEVAAGTPVP